MDRNFKLYFWGVATSNIGNILCSFASSIYLLDISHSPFIMSLFLGYSIVLNLVLTPFMGAFCDKHHKIKLIYKCDWVSSFINITIGLLMLIPLEKTMVFVMLFLLVTLNSFINSIFTPASMCALPLLVEENMLTKAYSRFSTMQNTVSVFGTIFSAVIYSVLGYPVLLILNGISYGGSAILEMCIQCEDQLSEKESTSFLDETKKGFQYLLSHKALLALAEVSVLANIFICAMFSVTLPFLINTRFDLDPLVLAGVEVAMSIGGITMAIKMSKLNTLGKVKDSVYTGFFIISAIFCIFAVLSYLYEGAILDLMAFVIVSLVLFFLVGNFLTKMQINIDANYAAHIEGEYMARVMAIRSVLSSSSAPASMIVFGALLDLMNYLPILVLLSIGLLLSAVFAYRSTYLDDF